MCLRSVFLPLVFLLAAYPLLPGHNQTALRSGGSAQTSRQSHSGGGGISSAILAEGYGRLGKIYLAQKAYEKAVTALEAAALARPRAPETSIDLAIAYFEAGQYEKASEPLEQGACPQSRTAPARVT